MVAKKSDAGVYKRGSKYVAKNASLGYQGTYNTEEAAKVAMKNARLSKDAPARKPSGGVMKRVVNDKDFSPAQLTWLARNW